MKKRALSLLMAFVMVIGLLPATTRAADINDVVAVEVTVYDQGKLVKDKNGKAVFSRTVEVKDQNDNGKTDIDDALYALHEACYDGGAAEGYIAANGDYGLSLFKLWGDSSKSFGYYVNDNAAWNLADQLVLS